MATQKKQAKTQPIQGVQTEIIIDATNATLGRLCSYAAKQALLGKKITIVNCEKAIITGDKRVTIEKYLRLRRMGGSAQKGPFFPKIPYMIVKRAVRGMLSHTQQRGKLALKRVMCYDSVPTEFADKPKMKAGREKVQKCISLEQLSKEI